MKKINLILIYFFSFIFMEFLFKFFMYDNVFRISNINMILFMLAISILLGVIGRLLKNEKNNKIIFIIIISIISIWFSAQYIIKEYFDFYISLSTFEVADQLGDFALKGVYETLKRIPIIIMFFIPLILSLLFRKYINLEKIDYKKSFGFICLFLIIYGFYIFSLNIKKDKAYSSYNLYYEINNTSLNIENFGILNSFVIDVNRAIFGFEEKITLDNNLNNKKETNNKKDEKEEIKYEYNNLDINFDELIKKEKNKTIKQLHEYFKNDTGTLKNEYTGKFKGKNLILFMAESFNEIAVDKELTPTLYKLVNNGFVFENFYTPTIYSTIGGEFQELTGLYAESTTTLKKFRTGEISFPLGIANKFKEIDYNTFAYHNNSYSFQDRDKYLKSLGFDNFKACYNGLEKLINCKEWPQSDVSMIENTINDYINEDNFMVFYATVSGHSSYTWGNAQAKKHKEEYMGSGLDYTEGPASYIAAQMELDKALQLLIEKLDEKNILDDTVIALVGDHYPYELTIDEVNEVSSYKKDSVVEVNRSNFILWNNKMDKVKVSKVGSQIDVIPTIYNVFGINYDSRLFIGKDILSTEDGLAMFSDRSWVTDKGTYFASKGEFVPIEGAKYDEEYINNTINIVNNKITMSKLIIENNYYKKVLK